MFGATDKLALLASMTAWRPTQACVVVATTISAAEPAMPAESEKALWQNVRDGSLDLSAQLRCAAALGSNEAHDPRWPIWERANR